MLRCEAFLPCAALLMEPIVQSDTNDDGVCSFPHGWPRRGGKQRSRWTAVVRRSRSWIKGWRKSYISDARDGLETFMRVYLPRLTPTRHDRAD